MYSTWRKVGQITAVTKGEGPRAAVSRGRLRRLRPWLVPGGGLLVLVLLTVGVLASSKVAAADWRIREFVQALATSANWGWLMVPAHLIVNLGNRYLAIPVLALVALVMAVRHRALMPVLVAAAATVLLVATVIPMKLLIGRPSPGYAAVTPDGFGAFPSGHTTTACVCYTVTVLLLLPDLSARRRRLAFAGLAVIWIAVPVALIWSDYHWFTDVVAGWALTAIIVPLAFKLPDAIAPI